MASISQRVGAINQKACTLTFGASAAANETSGAARVPLGRPAVEFTRSYLVGSSGFSLVAVEQMQTGIASKVPTFSVRATARDVLPRPPSGQSSPGLEMKQCIECKRAKPLVDFEKSGKSLRRSCRACVAVMRAERSGKEMAHMAMSVEESWKKAKPCGGCGLVKELRDFAVDKKAKDGAGNRCRACKSSNRLGSSVVSENQGSATIESQSPLRDTDGDAPVVSELTLERQFEVTRNIWETIMAEGEDDEELPVIIPDVAPASSDPIYQQTRSINSEAASETIAALQVKLLRLDFDLSHARATKAAFSDQIKRFEHAMANSTEENGKMRVALEQAVSSIADLETHVNSLEEEARNLRGRLLRLDFDLTHSRATKSLLGNRVEDLERAIAEDNEASRIRDEKLKAALAEATVANATLRAQVEEAQSDASKLKSKVLNFSLDLDNARFGKSMLSSKVQDLEKTLNASEQAYRAREEGVRRALDESNVAIAELESLRQSHNTLLSRSIRSDFDLEHQEFSKKVLSDKMADLERVVNHIREEDATVKAALWKATAANVELEAQVTGLQEETSKLKSKVQNVSMDLTKSDATRGMLGERVRELERMVSQQIEQAQARDEMVRTSLAESTRRLAEAKRIESEGGMLKSKLLRLDLDLAHARAHKDLLGDRVETLERMVDELRTDDVAMRAKLAEAVSSNAALEAEVTNLQLESTNLRNKVLYLSLDLTHAQAGKEIFSGKVQDLEKEFAQKAELVQTQEEKLQAAHALTAKLEAEVERLSKQEGKLLSQNLRQDFDLAHIKALKGVLDQRVFEIDGAIARRDEAEAKMKEAFAVRDRAVSNATDLEEQRNTFQSQSLRKDFDITHMKAMKAILSDRVADLERVVAVHADIGEKLKDATVDKAELEAEVDRLMEEGRSLQSKLLRKDFDMTHTRALKAILDSKVEDLESIIAGHTDMRNLAEARADKARLQSDVQRLDAERNVVLSQSIRKDFDLMHVQSLKALLEGKVSDLERVVDSHADTAQKLKDASMTNAALEAELQRLETQEGALRSQMLARDFDLTHTRALQKILNGRVEELQKVIDGHEDSMEELKTMSDYKKSARAKNEKLQSEVRRLQASEGKLKHQNFSKEFDLTHYRALKAVLEGRVEDLQKVIATHEDLSEKLKASHLANAELELEVGRLGEEGNGLRSKLLRQDFDLSNTRALKNILNEKVQDLERVIASHDDMGAKLLASKNENQQLEGKVARLEESEGELKSKVLRKDFDLQHYHALKNILDAKVQGLETAVANLDEAARVRDEKLRVALAEASASSAENALLKEETSNLKYQLFETGLDLTHAKAGKAILSDKVQDLERVLANYDELALARDSSLAEALSSVAELEAEVQRLEHERGIMQSKQIRMDFDLAHANAMRGILGDKVVDLETKGEFLSSALTEVITTKTELEGKVGELSDGLRAVRQEERSLRGNQAELKRQLFNLQLDNMALHRSTQKRTEMLQDKKEELISLEQALAAAHDEAAVLSRQLDAAVSQTGGGFFDAPAAPQQETVGSQLAQIATLTASVRNQGGHRVQIADTDADTDDDVMLSDEDSDSEDAAAPVSNSMPEKSEEDGSKKGLATAGLSVLLVLALGGSMLLHPTAASPHVSGSNTPHNPPIVRSAPKQQVVEVKKSNPPKAPPAVTRYAPPMNPIEQVAAMLLAEEPAEPFEDTSMLEVTTATGPTEEQQAEELDLVSEMSSKLFDATPSSAPPLADFEANFAEPECKVDMC